MIQGKQITIYTILCDECGVDYFKDDEDYNGFTDKELLGEEIDSNYEWQEHEGKHYCLSCSRKPEIHKQIFGDEQ